jgi:glycosyltransferase involved in cell wall biosynthesis
MVNVRVSTIIPTFNSAATLPAAIDSALAQEIEGHEIIVVDDGSTDDTESVLKSYGERIEVIQQENRGQSTARNVAIERAAGLHIAFLDADDIWLPGRLSKTIAALERNPAASLVFSDFVRIDQAGSLIQSSAVPASLGHPPSMDEILTHWWPIAPTTVTMPRSIWHRCGGFHIEATAFEDLYLFILARECGEFEYIAEPLAKFRVSGATAGPDKWSPDIFIQLIKDRYGARGRELIAEVQNVYAGAFASKALRAMEEGNRSEAVRCWRKVFHYEPMYAFKLSHFARIFRRRNLRRVAQLLWPKRPLETE